MRKWISLLLAAVLLLSLPVPALAETTGSIRHEVYGDQSELVLDQEAGNSTASVNGTEAQVGTDLYLFVDPDTASYITFYVTDEQGNPLENAQIYISYNGISEFYGTTNEDGEFSTYLFRNVTYGYTVKKAGFETATGKFHATEETERVHVVLRRYYNVNIFVVDDGEPVEDVTVIVDGVEYTTDENGEIQLPKTNGEYTGVVITPDGREIPIKIVVSDGDTSIVVDIAEDDAMVEGGNYSDRFLVYNKYYNPEDYVLTKYLFEEKDLEQAAGETDVEFQERVNAYLDQNPSTILVEAQPERKQHTGKADTDILKADGTPLYTQRSLMPTGYLLKDWEEKGYTDLVFTNEEMGLKVSIPELHGEAMMKVFALLEHLTNQKVRLHHITTEEVSGKWNSYAGTGLTELSRDNINDRLLEIDFTALKDYEFEFVHKQEEEPDKKHALLRDSLYTSSLFEFRITPITEDSLQEMVTDGLDGQQAMPKNQVMVASQGYFLEEIRRWRADGRLDDFEARELYHYVIDDKLTAQELEALQKDYEEDRLTKNAIDLLIQAAVEEKLYRVSCWVIYDDVQVDFTALLKEMQLIRTADERYEEIREALQAEYREKEETVGEAQLDQEAEAALAERYSFLLVDDTNFDPENVYNTNAGEGTQTRKAVLLRSLPEEDSEYYTLLTGKEFEELTVDVRLEDIFLDDENEPYYRAEIDKGTAVLELERALTCDWDTAVLAGLADNKAE